MMPWLNPREVKPGAGGALAARPQYTIGTIGAQINSVSQQPGYALRPSPPALAGEGSGAGITSTTRTRVFSHNVDSQAADPIE